MQRNTSIRRGPCETSAGDRGRLMWRPVFHRGNLIRQFTQGQLGEVTSGSTESRPTEFARDGFGRATLRGAASSGLLIDKPKRSQRRRSIAPVTFNRYRADNLQPPVCVTGPSTHHRLGEIAELLPARTARWPMIWSGHRPSYP